MRMKSSGRRQDPKSLQGKGEETLSREAAIRPEGGRNAGAPRAPNMNENELVTVGDEHRSEFSFPARFFSIPLNEETLIGCAGSRVNPRRGEIFNHVALKA
jgi:hypothetical protein